MSSSEVTAKASALSSELKEERTSLKKLKADYQQMQDDLAETKAEKEAGERVRENVIIIACVNQLSIMLLF